ncbi:MAG: alpha-amylase [Tissierellia bacterium]|nr:alpha-amylase [Tissierellia bacterium]
MTNEVMMQAFEWETNADGNFYKNLIKNAHELKENGIDALWLPPMCKGTSDMDVGYGIYDLWDLGEFDQKGTVRTKYGTKEELLQAIDALHKEGIKVYADVVLNHKAGADFAEEFEAVMVDQNDRNKEVEAKKTIKGWTGFDFKNRKGKYSDFVWHYYHFSGVDYDENTKTNAVYRIIGENKYWNSGVSSENGNYDYLMNADIDHSHPEVKEEIYKWIDWFLDTTKVDGIRYDALKHIDYDFIEGLSNHILEKKGDNFYFIGEYWKNDEGTINKYLDETNWNIDLFDVPLHYNFKEASESGRDYDMRKIFDDTLMRDYTQNCVTFVDNHDSQPSQSLESWVKDWFKEIAYSIILFRKDGYPCIFAGDYYGIGGENKIPGKKEMLDKMIAIRKKYAYGEQDDYFDHSQVVGWVRRGEEGKSPLVVLITTADDAQKQMFVGKENKNSVFIDISGKVKEEVRIDKEGNGVFKVNAGSVSYWVKKED